MAHTNEIRKFIDEASIENIYNMYSKIIGIESNPNIITENNKNLGMVIVMAGDTNLFLGSVVEYNLKKVKWKGSKNDDDGKFLYLIDPYWCKVYKPNPKIEVPIKVYIPKSNSVIEELCMMSKGQFIKNRLNEFYREWPYIYVASIDNFNYLRNKGYYYAINSTVKMYRIDQDILKSNIAKVNRNIDTINKEWNKLIRNYYENKEALKLVHEMLSKNKKDNVVNFKAGTKP